MVCAQELEPVASGLFLWRAYDSSSKTELFSTGLITSSGTYVIDPILLAPDAEASLGNVAGVIVTNENHQRSAAHFAGRFQAPIYSAGAPALRADFTAILIDGAARGEIAIHSTVGGGVIVMGDALINFEPYGFTFLPAKYCVDQNVMRHSLARLLDYSFERMLFAHGTPIQSGAREQLEALLNRHP